jgi:hypothetical protein
LGGCCGRGCGACIICAATWDNSNSTPLAYRPEEDAHGKKENEIAAQFHGCFYTPIEFVGDTAQID